MKLLLPALCGLLLSEAFAQQAQNQELLGKVQAFFEKTQDFRASFTQTVRTRTPKRTFVKQGVVYFKKPGMMRWDYKHPDETYYISDGQTLWSYEVEEGIVYRMAVKDSTLYEALKFLIAPADLKSDFDVEVAAPTGQGLVPLRLKPKGGARLYKTVTLFVDPQTGETKATEVVDPMGNVSHVTFENPSYAPLPLEGFMFTPPPGVTIQDLSREKGQ